MSVSYTRLVRLVTVYKLDYKYRTYNGEQFMSWFNLQHNFVICRLWNPGFDWLVVYWRTQPVLSVCRTCLLFDRPSCPPFRHFRVCYLPGCWLASRIIVDTACSVCRSAMFTKGGSFMSHIASLPCVLLTWMLIGLLFNGGHSVFCLQVGHVH